MSRGPTHTPGDNRWRIVGGIVGVLLFLVVSVFIVKAMSKAFRQGDASGTNGTILVTTSTTPSSSSVEASVETATTSDAARSTTSVLVAQQGPVPSIDATTVPPVSTSTSSPTPVASVSTASTLPDGTPVPVVAIFDTDTITLLGAVPSQAASDRLAALALANSQTPATVANYLTIDPNVPISVGVRVLELNSARFPANSSTVLPAHALELDRVANVMKALPNVTVLVVGHADQTGSDASNFLISAARAQAVVTYLVSVGIAPSRLASRAVGESDLLSVANDATSLTLNRRTEFIFYGLIIE